MPYTSAVSKRLTPRSRAAWTTRALAAASSRMPKLLQPRPATVTWMPESPSGRAVSVSAIRLPPHHQQVPDPALDALDRDPEGLAAVFAEPDAAVRRADVERVGIPGVAGDADRRRPHDLGQSARGPAPRAAAVLAPVAGATGSLGAMSRGRGLALRGGDVRHLGAVGMEEHPGRVPVVHALGRRSERETGVLAAVHAAARARQHD